MACRHHKPWKDGRIEIRRLLGKNDQVSQREAIKLTWDYLQKDDIGNGHELPMYLFLGNEPIWAVHAYQQRVADPTTEHPLPDLKSLASLYQKYDMFEEAKSQLDTAMKHIPGPPWTEMREAEIHSAYGSMYAAWGKIDLAKKHYSEAIRLFPTGKPPYGKHLLPRRAKKVQSKLDLLSMGSLAGQTLKDGKYIEKSLGYSGDINITMVIANGKVTKLETKHQEKIDQNACKLIPQRIIDAQSLQVDGVSGATVSKDAIIGGTFQALKKAGLK
ncbi:MAG: FMN-binding protein [Pirellulales bacterium]